MKRTVEEAIKARDRGEISRQRLHQIRRKEAGPCPYCSGTAPCQEHREAKLASAKARRAKRAKAEGRTPGQKGTNPGPRPELRGPRPQACHPHRCGRCGVLGHNRRTCTAP